MLKIVLAILITIFLSGNNNLHASDFTFNTWQLHKYDMPKLREAIERAPDYGVNSVIFSHRLFRSVEGFIHSGNNYDPEKTPELPVLQELYERSAGHTRPNPDWWDDIRELGQMCDERDIDWYVWIHELDDLPPQFFLEESGRSRVDLDDPALVEYLTDRYERLLEIIPGTAGFVLMYHETQRMVTRNRDVVSERSAPERIAYLTRIIYDVAKRHDKKLIIRNFFYEPIEKEYFNRSLDLLPDDIVVMSKPVPHEFHPFYPRDPIHGNTGNKPHIVELDLGFEKSWGEDGIYAQVDWIKETVQYLYESGGDGLVGRARLGWYDRGDPELWDKPFENIHEINFYAFSRFMEDPGLDVDEVWYDWASQRYPQKAVPYIVSSLKRTQFINHHGRYFLGWWVTKYIGREWDHYRYYFETPFRRSNFKWTQNPEDKETQEKLHNPDMEFYRKLIDEKEQVLENVHASIEDIGIAKRYLTADQYLPLERGFDWLLDAAELQLQWTRAYFAMRMWMNEPQDIYKILMEDALQELEFLDQKSGRRYGLNEDTGSRYHIDQFVTEMRWRTLSDRTRSRARNEEQCRMAWIRHRGDVTTDWYVPEPADEFDHEEFQWIDW